MITEFTPIQGLLGGGLIGLAAVLLMAGLGRIAGISGIFSGLLNANLFSAGTEQTWRIYFIGGLLIGAALFGSIVSVDVAFISSWPLLIIAGLLVGAGTQLGSGCTSGHGVCGMARLSRRSVTATLVFMLTAIIVVYFVRHIFAIT